jgi:hypothetical protein
MTDDCTTLAKKNAYNESQWVNTAKKQTINSALYIINAVEEVIFKRMEEM